MKRKLTVATWLLALVLGACSRSPSEDAPPVPAAVEHMGVGTLNSVDTAAGTVNISHGPVASAGWPQMTMDFKLADPRAAENLKPGERVDFHFTIQSGMNATVTSIGPIH